MQEVNTNPNSALFADAHYVTEKAFIPLSAVKTEADKKKYAKKGYMPGYTYDEWPQKYPMIPRDKVYYINGVNAETIYYDKRNVVYVPLRIFGTDLLYPWSPEKYVKDVCSVIKEQEQNSQKKEYTRLLQAMPDGIKMDAMSHLLDLEGPTPLFYSTFMEQYVAADFHCGNLPKRVINALEKSKSEAQKATTMENVEKLFKGRDGVTVYRGAADGSTDYRQAMSWTTNINVAFFFASWQGKNAVIHTGKLYKQDVLECVDAEENDEEEIIVIPGKVKRVTTLPLVDINSPDIKKNLGAIVERYHFWRDESVQLYQKAGKCNGCHDVLHTLRVLFLCITIGLHENFTDNELNELCIAAMYHDAARESDGIECGHGKCSAQLYTETLSSNPAVEFAIEMHCADDKNAAELLDDYVPEKERDKAWKILSVLKDANALDRVRFGFAKAGEEDGLDVNQLRHDYSKRLVPLAKQLLYYLEITT